MTTNGTLDRRRRLSGSPLEAGSRTRWHSAAALSGSALAIACALCAGVSSADDTEVYFGQSNPNADTKPNVLFILDTSGSMRSTDNKTQNRLDRMKDATKTMLRQARDINVGLMRFHNEKGGPVLFPVTGIDDTVCTGDLCGEVLATATVTSSLDDVEEYPSSSNAVATNGNILELIHDPNGREEDIGIRFTGLEVPRGAKIVEAHLDLTANRDDSGGQVILDIRSESSGDAATFSGAAGAVSSRTWNDTKATWALGDWKRHETYSSGDISTVIREVTKRPDWCGGNALALRLTRNILSTTKKRREAMTFENVTANQKGQVASLRVKYTLEDMPTGGGCLRTSLSSRVIDQNDDAEEYVTDRGKMYLKGNSLDMPFSGNNYRKKDTQTNGVRFRDIDIPQGATVRRAWIDFQVAEAKGGDRGADISLAVHGEDTDDAQPFRGKKYNVSGRTKTTAKVVWPNVPNVPVNAFLRTADLAPIVQEIVSRDNWRTGNAMAFVFTHHEGTGTRGLGTYRRNKQNAPRLVVEFEGSVQRPTGDDAKPIVARDELINLVDSLTATGATPIVDTLWEAALYYRGQPVRYGKNRGPSNKRYHRISHVDSYTGGEVVRDARCSDDNLNASVCASEKVTGSPIYVSPVANSCQTNHIVLLSDGEANGNVSANLVRNLTGTRRCEKDYGSEACGVELAEWLHETDLSDSIRNRQNVRLHTIAFNLDNPTFLSDLAKSGGGKLYEADDSKELLGAFESIINDVNSIDTSFTAPGATVNQFNRLTHRDDIYFAMFKPTDKARWSGNLKKFRIGKEKKTDGDAPDRDRGEVEIRDRNDALAVDESTGFFADEAFSFWAEKDAQGVDVTQPDGHDVTRGGAANQMKLTGISGGIGDRRTYTWVGAADSVPAEGVDLTAEAQRLHESNGVLSAGVLGVADIGNNEAETDAYRATLLKWARGVDVEAMASNGGAEVSRYHMGDPMHSRPVILNYADTSSGSVDGVRSIVFVATNEGYLHAIDSQTGEERFAFMPNELLGNLNPQFENKVGRSHPYGIDGPLSLWRDDRSGNKHVVDPGDKAYLYFGMRRGGSHYYALDVSTLGKPRLAWAIQGGETPTEGFEELGESWSRLTPVRMKINGVTRDVLLFGAGYDIEQDISQTATDPADGNTAQKGRGLYIVEATTGTPLWAGLGTIADTTGTALKQSFTGMNYPIAGNVRAIDVNRNGLVDQIYAADTGGQLWRFDVDESHSGSDKALMQGGIIADFSGSDPSARRRFYTEPDVALIEQEGRRFLTVSIGSGWRAHPLNTVVEDRFYVVRQNDVRRKPAANAYGIRQEDGTYRPIVDGDLIAVGNTASPEISDIGWYLDLKRTGEKILGTSITFDNSVIFSSYVPQASSTDCSTGIGGGRAYVLDIVSGAPKRDLDEDEDLDLDDESVALKHGGLPPDAMIMITEDSDDEPEILFGSEKMNAGVRNSTRRTFWSDRGEPEAAAAQAVGSGR